MIGRKLAGLSFAAALVIATVYPVLGQEDPKHESSFSHNATPGSGHAPAHTEETPAQAAAAVAAISAPVNCLTDQAALDDVRSHRERIEARGKELDSREAELKAREKALEEELKKLQQARDEIAQIDDSRKKENEERVVRIVDTLQAMSPLAAAKMLSEMDEALAVSAIHKMETPRLAKILNKMEPAKSSRLSEILAGVVRARKSTTASRDAAATTNSSAKGGDNHDGQNEQRDSSVQRQPGQQRKSEK